jgi:hypothetical protein
MAKRVVIDELHLTIRVPNDLPDDRAEAIRRVLNGEDFIGRMRRSVRALLLTFTELAGVTVTVSR